MKSNESRDSGDGQRRGGGRLCGMSSRRNLRERDNDFVRRQSSVRASVRASVATATDDFLKLFLAVFARLIRIYEYWARPPPSLLKSSSQAAQTERDG